VVDKFETLEYHQNYDLLSGISITFKDAGHVLGSAIVEIEAEGKKLVFSGDIGAGRLALLNPPDVPEDADYVVIESAYGDRLHEETESSKNLLEDAIEETVSQNGVLMIPSFALERTQEILYHLNDLVENNRIPQVPIYLDSPLAIGLTEIYKKYENYYRDEAKKLASTDNIFDFPGLTFTDSVAESKKINEVDPPKIIIAGAGMSQGGRILHHELRYLDDPKNTLLIVSYQAKGTLGREILEGSEEVKIMDYNVPVNAQIKQISGYSAHADQAELMNWIKQVAENSPERKPEKVFVCQGEPEASKALSQLMRDKLAIDAKVPEEGESVEL
jgi:metallo-beta-lactamase family protein